MIMSVMLITTVPFRLMPQIPIKKKRTLTLFCCFLFYGCCLQSMFYDFYSGQHWPIEGTPPSTATSTGPTWGSPPPPPLLDRPVRAVGGCTRETTTYAVLTPPPPATPPPTPTTMLTIRNLGRVSVLIFFLWTQFCLFLRVQIFHDEIAALLKVFLKIFLIMHVIRIIIKNYKYNMKPNTSFEQIQLL